MRRGFILVIAIVFCLVGCQPGNDRNDNRIDYSKIAGVWKAENAAWEITISGKGEVISAVHALGSATVKPNEITYLEMKDGSSSSYQSGDFTLVYEPNKNEMEVTLKIEKIHVKYLYNDLEGENETIFTGFVSDDFTEWDADIIELFDYGERFPSFGVNPQPMKFKKVSN